MPLRVQRHRFGIAGEICRLCDLVQLLDHFEKRYRSPSQTPHSVLAELIPGQFFNWNHAHKNPSKTLKVTETQAAQERARERRKNS